MKQFYFLSLLSCLCLTNLDAQTTFDWEDASDNGATISQTVNTITATFETSDSDPQYLSGGGFGGSFGFVVVSGATLDNNVTITFSQPINVESIYVFDGNSLSPTADWTLTPTGGANSNVVASVEGLVGTNVVLNWSDVTQITITSSAGNDYFGVDEIISDFTLSTQQFEEANSQLNLYPNPSTDFIKISNLTETETYSIYNILGSQIAKGQVSQNDKIDIRNFSTGMYLLKLDSGKTMKFVKK